MSIKLFGNNSDWRENKIEMPDGNYIYGGCGSSGSSWSRFWHGVVWFGGSTSITGDTYVALPYSVSNLVSVVGCEPGAGGWAGTNVTGYGFYSLSSYGFTIRGYNTNGNVVESPASGITCNWIAFGYTS
jgi:hypothetical protein